MGDFHLLRANEMKRFIPQASTWMLMGFGSWLSSTYNCFTCASTTLGLSQIIKEPILEFKPLAWFPSED